MNFYEREIRYGAKQYSVAEGQIIKRGDVVVLSPEGVGVSTLKAAQSPIEKIQHIIHCIDGTPSPFIDSEGRSAILGIAVEVSTDGTHCMVSKEKR